MDQQSLRVFTAVAELGSFTLASEQLFMTQPAVSKRIANLEAQLGARLFDRVGHTIHLTAAGRVLKTEAQTVLQSLAFARHQIQNLNAGVSGPLNIVTSHHIGLHRLPPTLRYLRQTFPEIELNVQFMDSEEAYAGVTAGNIECALLTLPDTIDNQLESYPIWTDELAIFCAHNSTIANIEPLDLCRLSEFPVVLPEKHTFTRLKIVEFFKSHGIRLDKIRNGDYLETIKTLVECDLGWSVLPKKLANPKLKQLFSNSFHLSRPLGLLHHKKRPLSKAAVRFLTLLENDNH